MAARSGSSQASSLSRSSRGRRRSLYTATYFSRAELHRAPELMRVELTKLRRLDLTGEAWEQVWAEIVKGQVIPGRHSRPEPDGWDRHGTAFSIKTFELGAAESRPEPVDYLGQATSIPISRLQPKGRPPAGKSFFDLPAADLGRRLIASYNEMLEKNGIERYAFLARVRLTHHELNAYLYWTEEAKEIDPGTVYWTDSPAESDGWTRNLHGRYRPAGSRQRPRSGATDISWTSGGSQLKMRVTVPDDADIFVVPLDAIGSREEASKYILEGLNARLLG